MTIVVPQEVWDDLRYQIACAGDIENPDNFRAYRYRDRFGFQEWLEAERKGCCGFFGSHTMVAGEKWIIGCNYGH